MIIKVDESNIIVAAEIHSASWKESHKDFCDKAFIERHSVKQQEIYLRYEIALGKDLYMLVDKTPTGIISVDDSLIENLYVLPAEQRKGYGSQLLEFAISRCTDTPSLWILDNNHKAYSFYYKHGFRKTDKTRKLSESISEIELKLTKNTKRDKPHKPYRTND